MWISVVKEAEVLGNVISFHKPLLELNFYPTKREH